MLAQMLNSEVNGTSAYKIEYEELEVPVRRGASGMGIVVNAHNILIEKCTGGQAEEDDQLKIGDLVVAIDGTVLGKMRIREAMSKMPPLPAHMFTVRRSTQAHRVRAQSVQETKAAEPPAQPKPSANMDDWDEGEARPPPQGNVAQMEDHHDSDDDDDATVVMAEGIGAVQQGRSPAPRETPPSAAAGSFPLTHAGLQAELACEHEPSALQLDQILDELLAELTAAKAAGAADGGGDDDDDDDDDQTTIMEPGGGAVLSAQLNSLSAAQAEWARPMLLAALRRAAAVAAAASGGPEEHMRAQLEAVRGRGDALVEQALRSAMAVQREAVVAEEVAAAKTTEEALEIATTIVAKRCAGEKALAVAQAVRDEHERAKQAETAAVSRARRDEADLQLAEKEHAVAQARREELAKAEAAQKAALQAALHEAAKEQLAEQQRAVDAALAAAAVKERSVLSRAVMEAEARTAKQWQSQLGDKQRTVDAIQEAAHTRAAAAERAAAAAERAAAAAVADAQAEAIDARATVEAMEVKVEGEKLEVAAKVAVAVEAERRLAQLRQEAAVREAYEARGMPAQQAAAAARAGEASRAINERIVAEAVGKHGGGSGNLNAAAGVDAGGGLDGAASEDARKEAVRKALSELASATIG